jgi:hypothetical protein
MQQHTVSNELHRQIRRRQEPIPPAIRTAKRRGPIISRIFREPPIAVFWIETQCILRCVTRRRPLRRPQLIAVSLARGSLVLRRRREVALGQGQLPASVASQYFLTRTDAT